MIKNTVPVIIESVIKITAIINTNSIDFMRRYSNKNFDDMSTP
jgi:hypothetical protein